MRRESWARATCGSSRASVEIPESVGEPDEPPHVLFVGRLSPEKGIHEFLAATEGLPRVIVGAGPVDVPEAVGFVPRARARPVLRAGGGRLRPVPPRGLRRRRAGGDGVRPAGRRDGGRRARRRDTESSSRRATWPGCARCSSSCSPTATGARTSAPPRARPRGTQLAPEAAAAALVAVYEEAICVKPSLLLHAPAHGAAAPAAGAGAPAAAAPPARRRSAAAVPAARRPDRALALAGVRVAAARRSRLGAPARLPRPLRRGRARRGACRRRGGARGRLLADWIERNPPRPGDAWHPYTISTRAGNWIAALSLLPELETRPVRESLWRQLVVLGRNVEDDVLGNHVIRNARALVLGGGRVRRDGAARARRRAARARAARAGAPGRRPLRAQPRLPPRRPARPARGRGGGRPFPASTTAIERMRGFAAGLARPDGAPALFNDGGLDLAPQLDLPAAADGLSLFPETGYAVLRTPRVWLAFDCGPPSPPYLPAHAHADALSFQLWVDGQPRRRRSRHVHVRAGRRARLVPRHARALDRRRRRRPVRALGRVPLRPAAARRAARGLGARARRSRDRASRRAARAPDSPRRQRADDPRPSRGRRETARRELAAARSRDRAGGNRDRIRAGRRASHARSRSASSSASTRMRSSCARSGSLPAELGWTIALD